MNKEILRLATQIAKCEECNSFYDCDNFYNDNNIIKCAIEKLLEIYECEHFDGSICINAESSYYGEDCDIDCKNKRLIGDYNV